MKDFVKKCKNANYCKVIKGLLDKIQENSKVIEERRNKVTFSIRDKKQVVSQRLSLIIEHLNLNSNYLKGFMD